MRPPLQPHTGARINHKLCSVKNARGDPFGRIPKVYPVPAVPGSVGRHRSTGRRISPPRWKNAGGEPTKGTGAAHVGSASPGIKFSTRGRGIHHGGGISHTPRHRGHPFKANKSRQYSGSKWHRAKYQTKGGQQ